MVAAAIGNWGDFTPGDPNSTMNQNLKLLKNAVISLTLTNPTPTPIPGDIDNNNTVNIIDYNIIVTHMQKKQETKYLIAQLI